MIDRTVFNPPQTVPADDSVAAYLSPIPGKLPLAAFEGEDEESEDDHLRCSDGSSTVAVAI